MKRLLDFLPKNWKEILGWIILTGASLLASRLGIPGPTPPGPPPVPVWENEFGWVPDPEAVKAVQADLDFKVFADTPAGLSDDPLPAQVYLWDAWKKLGMHLPPAKNQGSIGSCVSFGTNNAVLRTMAVQIALFKAPEELKDIAEEVTYGGSRVQVGKGQIRGDGSVGAWAAKFVNQWGVVAREKTGAYDLSAYSVATCRQYGQKGAPPELAELAKQHPVRSITLVQTWADAKKALASGYGIAICSGQGFSMTRDKDGIARASGSWAHCMCLDGYCTINGKEYGHIENSWGPDAHRGPVGPGDPSTAGFWADAATITRMLRAGDSWAFSAVKGFPQRQIDWFVRADHRDRLHAQAVPGKRTSSKSSILSIHPAELGEGNAMFGLLLPGSALGGTRVRAGRGQGQGESLCSLAP